MVSVPQHKEDHAVGKIGWLRAAVLGANDGIVSTSSLVVGVAAAGSGKTEILIAGLAGLTAGAMSMAAGEYVSVSSQADAEEADIAFETKELATHPEAELEELTQIYVDRGLDRDLASKVAVQLTERDALSAHVRDEMGITEQLSANPIQAAMVSAAMFGIGAVVPVFAAFMAPPPHVLPVVAVVTLAALGVLGAFAAKVGGARKTRGATRVVFWGATAMAATALVGWMFGVTLE